MTFEEKYIVLKKIFWDYHTEKLPLEKIINGDFHSVDDYSFNLIIVRMFERLNWYDLIEILGLNKIRQLLTVDTIAKLHFTELRDKYEFLRKVLSGEDVSFTGWGDAYYQQIKHTLFSNRWYSPQQALF